MYNLHIPAPGTIQEETNFYLVFNGNYLCIVDAANTEKLSAWSGQNNQGEHKNYSLELQQQTFGGPVPEGAYWINPSELWENNWLKSWGQASSHDWSTFRLTLHVRQGTQTYQRCGFFIRGGNAPGGSGSIEVGTDMNTLVKSLRRRVGWRHDTIIPVWIAYSPSCEKPNKQTCSGQQDPNTEQSKASYC
jgi:hypothetical protein